MRPSKLTAEAPLVVLVDWVVGVLEAEGVEEEATVTKLGKLEGVAVTGVELELLAEVTTGPVTDTLLPPSVASKLGGGTAVEGSTRAPTPQGMSAPDSGWVAFAGGVVWPEEEAMAKRVVHALSGV